MAIPVIDIFESIQGEGKNQGVLSIFLRLAFCNLRCSFCDSKYTYENPKFEWKEKNEVLKIINRFNSENLVITGGEPLLWQKELSFIIKDIKKLIEVETNGTIIPLKEFDKYITQYNVSPKLSNSGEDILKRINKDSLKWFSKEERVFFKYVIKEEKDIEEVFQHIKEFKIKKEKIYLMPCANTQRELEEKAKKVADLCIKYGFNYSDRLQIRLSIP